MNFVFLHRFKSSICTETICWQNKSSGVGLVLLRDLPFQENADVHSESSSRPNQWVSIHCLCLNAHLRLYFLWFILTNVPITVKQHWSHRNRFRIPMYKIFYSDLSLVYWQYRYKHFSRRKTICYTIYYNICSFFLFI